MIKSVKVYKPSRQEILTNVLQSFEIENIYIKNDKAEQIFEKVIQKKLEK